MAGGAPGARDLADPGGGPGGLAQELARLPAALKGLQDRAVAEAVKQAAVLDGEHLSDRHRVHALAVVLDGGGAALTAGPKCDLEAPWAYVLEGWALYANAAGSLALDLEQSASYAAYPDDLVSICGDAPPTLASAQKARGDTPDALADWTTALPRGAVLRVVVDTASGISLATLTLFVRAV